MQFFKKAAIIKKIVLNLKFAARRSRNCSYDDEFLDFENIIFLF